MPFTPNFKFARVKATGQKVEVTDVWATKIRAIVGPGQMQEFSEDEVEPLADEE